MSPRKIYTREKILGLLQEFVRESGRPPKVNEPNFEPLVQAAKNEFGSWSYALKIAGIQTYKSWRKKKTVGGRLCILLNNNPMTFAELRQEFGKNEDSLISAKTSQNLSVAISQNSQIKSMGPRKSKVYYLQGQEKLAQSHLAQAPSLDEKQDFIFCALRKPMTKSEVRGLFQESKSTSCIDRLLKELVLAELVRKVDFVSSKGSKFSAADLFGNIAYKTYYFRCDCPKELVEMLALNIPRARIQESGFATSLTHHLKRILPPDVSSMFVSKMI